MTDVFDHFYKGRWWSESAYDAFRAVEVKMDGKAQPLQPGEGPPDKIRADRTAGTISPETLKLMEG
jgi:hypothetical protein